jgi:hypothetical protein
VDEVTKLYQLAKLVRSKNAKPFLLTIDIIFGDEKTYKKVKKTGVINRELFSKMYHIPIENVLYVEYDEGNSFKITIPRPIIQGDINDRDVYGCQQIGDLPDLDIPLND